MSIGFVAEALLERFVTSFEKLADAAERFSFVQCKHEESIWTSCDKYDQVEGTCKVCGAQMKMDRKALQWILEYKSSLKDQP